MNKTKVNFFADLNLINIDDVQRITKCSRLKATNEIKKIRLLMFLDGYTIPLDHIDKKYFKRYFDKKIDFSKYDKEYIDFILKSAFR